MKSIVLYSSKEENKLRFYLLCEEEAAETAAKQTFTAEQRTFVILSGDKWKFLFDALRYLQRFEGLRQIEEAFLQFVLRFYNATQTP